MAHRVSVPNERIVKDGCGLSPIISLSRQGISPALDSQPNCATATRYPEGPRDQLCLRRAHRGLTD